MKNNYTLDKYFKSNNMICEHLNSEGKPDCERLVSKTRFYKIRHIPLAKAYCSKHLHEESCVFKRIENTRFWEDSEVKLKKKGIRKLFFLKTTLDALTVEFQHDNDGDSQVSKDLDEVCNHLKALSSSIQTLHASISSEYKENQQVDLSDTTTPALPVFTMRCPNTDKLTPVRFQQVGEVCSYMVHPMITKILGGAPRKHGYALIYMNKLGRIEGCIKPGSCEDELEPDEAASIREHIPDFVHLPIV